MKEQWRLSCPAALMLLCSGDGNFTLKLNLCLDIPTRKASGLGLKGTLRQSVLLNKTFSRRVIKAKGRQQEGRGSEKWSGPSAE